MHKGNQASVGEKGDAVEECKDDGRKNDSQHHIDRCRFTTLLPLFFVVIVILTLYGIYMKYHLQPLLQIGVPSDKINQEDLLRGRTQAFLFHFLTLFMILCYLKCIFVHPGSVPYSAEWVFDWESSDDAWQNAPKSTQQQRETKRTGERRYCKWCGRYKPDRCHHCRVCKQCVLRMDHHCPWIVNCVGFRNHKYFFLLVFYSAADCIFIASTMLSSVENSISQETAFGTMFMLVFGETLAIMMGFLVSVFFSFHIWLMARATTTIEFCEKSTKGDFSGGYRSIYDLGLGGNLRAVLGPKPLLWLLPCSPPEGDGLSFPVGESTPLVDSIPQRS